MAANLVGADSAVVGTSANLAGANSVEVVDGMAANLVGADSAMDVDVVGAAANLAGSNTAVDVVGSVVLAPIATGADAE